MFNKACLRARTIFTILLRQNLGEAFRAVGIFEDLPVNVFCASGLLSTKSVSMLTEHRCARLAKAQRH